VGVVRDTYEDMTETAIYAAGCFWGVEADFRRADGVTATRVGYTGGRTDHPTYRQVCGKRTGHAEAVEVTFDPAVISYDELLERFWAVHDPTTRNRQGFDIGSQYRSAIFFASPAQEEAATRSRDAQQAALEEDGGRTVSARGLTTGLRLVLGRRRRVVTEITPATTFWPAEDHHQRYLEKRGQATCAVALRAS
jgi:peptide-methionine (S)-S-oxide reductase